jgi:Mg-chelatase subunit ChlD
MLDQRFDRLERLIEDIWCSIQETTRSIDSKPQVSRYSELRNPPHVETRRNAMNVPTSLLTFVETQHGRLRRQQRGIDKKDLQAAIKYGKRFNYFPRRNGDECSRYVYNDITYIVNEVTREEITSYAKALELETVPESAAMRESHERAVERIQNDLDSWTSNTVFVVDTSGSMREADVWGTRSRLSAVWVSIALDFLAHRLESGEACETDVISIVTLAEHPQLVVNEMPSNWVLFNQLVRIYEDHLVPAYGHGPFLPSLQQAQDLLTRNPNAACALSLTFLSDGAPSDFIRDHRTKHEWDDLIVKNVEELAAKFGRRLTFTTIGIGSDDKFSLLNRMADAAADFGVKAAFMLPSMTSSSLGGVFTSVATALTSTQTEMTDVETLKQRKVRQVDRESRRKANEVMFEASDADFWIYPRSRVVRQIYKEYRDEDQAMKREFVEAPLLDSNAAYVALSKRSFGEGAERNAFRFYEIGSDGKTIVGKPLVAKESRLILASEQGADERARRKFVRLFCSTQQLARRLAKEFNEKLDKTRRVDSTTPRIAFLDCSVYQLDDVNIGKASVLVEEKLDHTKWHKWNANNGFVDSMTQAPVLCSAALSHAFVKVDAEDLSAIEEESEDEEDEEADDISNKVRAKGKIEPKVFSASEVAQAFSHFTYLATGRKRLVCDLQGVYNENARMLHLSDPVIHYYNGTYGHRTKVHGDTDRGQKGMRMFFATHECGHLCRLVLRGFQRSRDARPQRTKSYVTR